MKVNMRKQGGGWVQDKSITNLSQILEKSAERFGCHPALYFLNHSMDYNQLRQEVHAMAAALQKIGVKKNHRVAIMLPNTIELVISFYAILAIGAQVVMCSPLFTIRELNLELSDSDAKTLITLDLFWPKAKELKQMGILSTVILTTLSPYLSDLKRILYPFMRRFKGKVNFAHGEEAYFFDQLLEEFAGITIEVIGNTTRLDDLAAIQYTSGTTGVPQGVMLTHGNLYANACQVSNWFPELEAGGERMLAVLPFFHIFGLTVCLNMMILTGGVIILIPKFSGKAVDKLLDEIQKHRPTLFPAVPTIYTAVNNFVKIKEYDLSSIKFCISGAAPLPAAVHEKFQQLTGAVLVEGYGLSEASPVTHCNPLNKEKNKLGSIGVPLADTQAKIVDVNTGKELPIGEVGELVVKGPQVMQGYWNQKEMTQHALRDGWLHTGDMARMDEEGYYYIVDRLKELIIVAGGNVFPREVEEVLCSHPKITEAAVIGIPDEYRGEVVKAFVVLEPGERLSEKAIRDYCSKNLAPYKVPKKIEFRDELPKSIIGKVQKKKLKKDITL